VGKLTFFIDQQVSTNTTHLKEISAEPLDGVKQGRLDIIEAILSLEPHKFNPSATDNINISYDVAYLGEAAGLLLACYGQVFDPHQNHQLFVNQSFVLRQKALDEEDRCVTPLSFSFRLILKSLPAWYCWYRFAEGVWPLVAVSHQMVVRDLRYTHVGS
jgi:hypothetical protein